MNSQPIAQVVVKKQTIQQSGQKPFKNTFNIQQIIKSENWSRLKKIRYQIAKSSIKKSIFRLNKQKRFQQSFDQIQIEELFDQKVSQNIHYEEYSSQYADTSTINKGRFSKGGRLYGTVGSSGEGWVWNTENTEDSKNFTQKLTALKADVKLCDIAFHPCVGEIPAFAPNICTSTSSGDLLFWTFSPTLQSQKSIKLSPHTDRINSIQYHQSGLYFLCSSYDSSWSFYDSTKLQQIYQQKGHQKEIHTSVIHPDGSLYFTGDLAGYGQVWDLRTGKGVFQVKESDSILCADWSNNGYQLALGGKSNMITVKDIRRMKNIKQIPAHTKLVSGLKYHPNQSILCSVSHDNNLKLWHGRSYISVNLQPLMHSSKVTSVDIHQDKISTTTIQRKWSMWLLKSQQKDSTKLQAISQDDDENNQISH